jgi:O-acetyl-ADP-ribose deacetylase (regulator of RNase III)
LGSGRWQRLEPQTISQAWRSSVIGTIEQLETNAMMEFKTGNLLESNAEALVNTVNCVGIMGRGIALQFKDTFPENFKAYAKACERGELQPGRMFVFPTGWVTGPKYIINFPTKRHWRGKSRIEDIEAGLVALRDEIQERGIRSIAIPPLGAGLGGLDWNQVRPRIEHALKALDHVLITVYEPNSETNGQSVVRAAKPPLMTPGRAALIGLMRRYLGGLLDPSVTLLEVHKLMYFLQISGEPLKLRFTQAIYGPYAENLRHVLKAVEGYYVTGYIDDGDSPLKELQVVPGALEDAKHILDQNSATSERIERVADLVDGFETPFGLELLSTVHWVASHTQAQQADDIISGVYAWSERKKQFTERQIRLALGVLSQKHWLQKPVAP